MRSAPCGSTIYDPSHWLRPDGSNLANILAVLQVAQPDAKDRIEESLRALLPGLARVRVEPVFYESHPQGEEGQRIALVFQQIMNGSVPLFGPSQMSEGTLRALAILTALYQVEPYEKRRPTMTGIEDVEAAVHPGALKVLIDAFEEASLTTQVLVTTHSPELLDDKEIAADSVLAVVAGRGVTRIGPLTEGDRSVVRDRLFTVGQLLRATRLEPADQGTAGPAGEPPRLFEQAGA